MPQDAKIRAEKHSGERPSRLVEMDVERWEGPLAAGDQDAALRVIESGDVLVFPHLPFTLMPEERRFLSPQWASPKAKNISFDPARDRLAGAQGSDADCAALRAMITRFADGARSLVTALFPCYATALTVARTSFRPMPAAERESSWRKDDRLLHVDAFPSRPNGGDRILRVFTNVNPDGEPRIWRVGEPFENIGARLFPRVRPPLPGAARLLATLGITKGERTRYDHIMLQLHDRMKSDADYQRNSERTEIGFAPGTSWVCFSDQVSHAVVQGQFVLEHTILLPLSAMREPHRSPLRILERLAGHALT